MTTTDVELTVPTELAFADLEWMSSQVLAERAATLIDRHADDLGHLEGVSVAYFWKRTGGTVQRRPKRGATIKTSGLLAYFSDATFVIWLAADHCRGLGYGDRQLEAQLLHQLLQADIGDEDEETGRGGGARITGPDAALFKLEVETYGAWSVDLAEVAPAFRQARLPGA